MTFEMQSTSLKSLQSYLELCRWEGIYTNEVVKVNLSTPVVREQTAAKKITLFTALKSPAERYMILFYFNTTFKNCKLKDATLFN